MPAYAKLLKMFFRRNVWQSIAVDHEGGKTLILDGAIIITRLSWINRKEHEIR